ncbi:MAG: ATP-dependent nuclease [Peptococcaceae bacterium]
MELIHSIEIMYFRSIYNLTIKDIKSLIVLAGINDAGKSNILKALNLFFNNETEFETPIDFYKDFSVKRLNQVRRRSIKGKQFISIKVIFSRGNRCENTLPEKFAVTKKWHRDSKTPDVTDDLKARLNRMGKYTERDLVLAKTSLTRFLNSLKYIYIPAIKDQDVFTKVLSNLQDAIFDDNSFQQSGLPEQLASFNESIVGLVTELNADFQNATGITSSVSLPTNFRDIYKAFFIHTNYGKDGQFIIPLEQRGDGIRVRYIPSILHYITKLSKNKYIWGFEEPENSLEFRLCSKMASNFLDIYSKEAQIFVTSHSPAFFSLQSEEVLIKRIAQDEYETKEMPYSNNEDFIDELGFTDLQKEVNEILIKRIQEMEATNEKVKFLEQVIEETTRPIVITEGKTDKKILETAWNKLYQDTALPFKIESCDVMPANHPNGGSAGYDILAKSLEVVRPSNVNIVIGIFDNDKAGYEKGFCKLSKNFIEQNPNVKIHKNNKSIAVVLPTPPGKEQFANSLNLPIEFYFNESGLDKEVNGIKIGLTPQKVRMVTESGIVVGEQDATELHLMKVERNTKTYFAETIVPTLESEEFANFRYLFELLIGICESYSSQSEAAIE